MRLIRLARKSKQCYPWQILFAIAVLAELIELSLSNSAARTKLIDLNSEWQHRT
ncbi:hypothetical protein S7335_2862 [Synechococcus sp. PCC 7335]|nr:hypothetical protein S7335_2862 [Synechococcus sp. PCC 7335]